MRNDGCWRIKITDGVYLYQEVLHSKSVFKHEF